MISLLKLPIALPNRVKRIIDTIMQIVRAFLQFMKTTHTATSAFSLHLDINAPKSCGHDTISQGNLIESAAVIARPEANVINSIMINVGIQPRRKWDKSFRYFKKR